MAASASVDTAPDSSSGTTSTVTPQRRSAWSMLTKPLAYSALPVRMRSPRRSPSDQNAWCQANVAFSTRAISSGAAPMRAATSA